MGSLTDVVTFAGDGSAARLGMSWAFNVSLAFANAVAPEVKN